MYSPLLQPIRLVFLVVALSLPGVSVSAHDVPHGATGDCVCGHDSMADCALERCAQDCAVACGAGTCAPVLHALVETFRIPLPIAPDAIRAHSVRYTNITLPVPHRPPIV